MAEVTIKIPDDIKELVTDTDEVFYVEALREVARRKMSQMRNQIEELKERVSAFENKYGKKYEDFSKSVPDTIEGHDDWIEWSYLDRVTNESIKKQDKIKVLLGE